MSKKRSKKTNNRLSKQLKEIVHPVVPIQVPLSEMDGDFFSEQESYTFFLDPVIATAPEIDFTEITKFASAGYGGWESEASPNCEKRLDLMGDSYQEESAKNTSSLLNFFALTDIHITDGNHPGHGVYLKYGGGIVSVFSELMLYTTHVLDAAVHAINALHHEHPFDFGLSMGDNANNAQYNEIRWSIDVFDGEAIKLDFGMSDDPKIGPRKNFCDEFTAVGIDPQIPWYQIIGNHDHYWPGKKTDEVSPEPDRRFLSRIEWMREFFKTTSKPDGHGFEEVNLETGFACYTFEPRSEMPIKMIVLDDTQGDSDLNVNGYAHGSMDRERFDWLVSELDKGQNQGKLMIIAAHIPIGVKYVEPLIAPFMDWSTISEVSEKEVLEKLHTYPNLILWVAGHRHRNTVTPLKSPDPKHPELGFWEVETASLRDFPQNFRTFEIFGNSDHTLSIFSKNISPMVKPGSFASRSRSYAIASQQIFTGRTELLPTGSYNGELVIQLSPEMQKKIAGL